MVKWNPCIPFDTNFSLWKNTLVFWFYTLVSFACLIWDVGSFSGSWKNLVFDFVLLGTTVYFQDSEYHSVEASWEKTLATMHSLPWRHSLTLSFCFISLNFCSHWEFFWTSVNALKIAVLVPPLATWSLTLGLTILEASYLGVIVFSGQQRGAKSSCKGLSPLHVAHDGGDII